MKKQEPIELELKDWKEIEQVSSEGVRNGLKMQVASMTTLLKAEDMIRAFGEETERERIVRVREEQKKENINTTAS